MRTTKSNVNVFIYRSSLMVILDTQSTNILPIISSTNRKHVNMLILIKYLVDKSKNMFQNIVKNITNRSAAIITLARKSILEFNLIASLQWNPFFHAISSSRIRLTVNHQTSYTCYTRSRSEYWVCRTAVSVKTVVSAIN